MSKMKGGCLCGSVHYTSDAEPLMTVICHCKNCQRQTGSSFSTNIAIPRGALNIEGELAVYADTGDTGNAVIRYFCQKCGSHIFNNSETLDTLTILKAGSLDDTSWVRPTMEVYCDSAQEWTKTNEQLESHPKMLPT
jgi:hypothetical protein